MKVGILIPTFNRKQYLMQALESVLDQSHRELDVIVIDNGSTDSTAEFMATVSDSRVHYVVNNSNIGMIGSINKGINLFSDKVEWCTILSDDDILDKDFVMNLAQTVVNTDAKSIIHSHRIFIDTAGNNIREAPLPPQEETALDYIKMRAHNKRETYLTGVMFNRKTFLAIVGYPAFATGLASDDAFIFALALKDRLVFDRDAVAYIRLHEKAESATSSDGLAKLQTIDQFREYCGRVAKEYKSYDEHQLKEFEYSMTRYVRGLKSGWWIKTAQSIFDQNNFDRDQFSTLLSLVKENRYEYTFRVKLAIACNTFFGVFPERFLLYRFLWTNIIKFSQFLQKAAGA